MERGSWVYFVFRPHRSLPLPQYDDCYGNLYAVRRHLGSQLQLHRPTMRGLHQLPRCRLRHGGGGNDLREHHHLRWAGPTLVDLFV
jgi:hypothetical protein